MALDDARFPPGCLLPVEASLLYHLARNGVNGDGAIVDCGAFLGKSAALLAQGLLDRDASLGSAPLVHSFDWFRVCDEHDVGFISACTGEVLEVGDSTRAIFDRLTSSWARHIAPHEGNFLDATWQEGPIDILFIDVCKTPALNGHVLTTMFPALVPGCSVVIQQDYHHAHHPVVHTSLESLAEFIQPLATRIDDSYVFCLSSPIPSQSLAAAAAVDRLDPDAQMSLMDAALARLPADERCFVALARTVLIAQLFGPVEGVRALDALSAPSVPEDRAKWEGEAASVRRRMADMAARS